MTRILCCRYTRRWVLAVLWWAWFSLGAVAWAHEGPSSPAYRVGLPCELRPVTEASPRLAGPEHARRRWLLSLDGALLGAPCPGWSESCDAPWGRAARLGLWSRPSPLFSWGGMLLRSSHRQTFAQRQLTQQVDTQATAGMVAARVWLSSFGVFDPYLEAAIGWGQLSRTGLVRSGAQSVRADEQRWAPLYSASFGADWHLGEHLRLGGFLGFRHWLVHPAERCAEAFGVCSLPTPSFFSPDAGVWNVGVSASVSWGDPH